MSYQAGIFFPWQVSSLSAMGKNRLIQTSRQFFGE